MLDEIPLTFLRYFCIGSTLRWLMSSIGWPDNDHYRDMAQAYRVAFGDALRGLPGLWDQSDDFVWDHAKESCLEGPMYALLFQKVNATSKTRYRSMFENTFFSRLQPRLPDSVIRVKKVDRDGLRFGTVKKNFRNSFIMFNKTEDTSNPQAIETAGQIQDIFFHRRMDGGRLVTECFLVVQAYTALNAGHQNLDPWRRFR